MKKRNMILAVVAALSLLAASSVMAFAADAQPAETKVAGNRTVSPEASDLTDEQRDAIRQAGTDSLEAALESLVNSDILSQDEADAILDKASANEDEGGAPPSDGTAGDSDSAGLPVKTAGPFADLTDAQREALHDELQSRCEDDMAELVDDGTLTQEEADQLLEDGGKGPDTDLELTDSQKDALKNMRQDSMELALENLVDNDTLTQAEADAILENFASRPDKTGPVVNGPGGIFADLSDDQISALKDAINSNYEDAIAKLVDDGTITQEVADRLLDCNAHGGIGMIPGFGRGHGPDGMGPGGMSTAGTADTDAD